MKEGDSGEAYPTVRPIATSTRLSAVAKPLEYVELLSVLSVLANLRRPPFERPEGS